MEGLGKPTATRIMVHIKLRSMTRAHDIMEFSKVNMDAWYYRISVAWDTME